jgi:hypothetical protein
VYLQFWLSLALKSALFALAGGRRLKKRSDVRDDEWLGCSVVASQLESKRCSIIWDMRTNVAAYLTSLISALVLDSSFQ